MAVVGAIALTAVAVVIANLVGAIAILPAAALVAVAFGRRVVIDDHGVRSRDLFAEERFDLPWSQILGVAYDVIRRANVADGARTRRLRFMRRDAPPHTVTGLADRDCRKILGLFANRGLEVQDEGERR